jgi:hypothetical protein
MAPAPVVILTSDEWLAAVRAGCPLAADDDYQRQR